MHLAVRSQFLALLVLAMAAFAIERLIVTDAEAIEALAERAAQATFERDWTALEACLDEDFHYGRLDRRGTLDLVQGLVARHNPTRVSVTLFDIEVDGTAAKAKGIVAGTAYGRPVQVRVEAELRYVDDERWVLSKLTGGGF